MILFLSVTQAYISEKETKKKVKKKSRHLRFPGGLLLKMLNFDVQFCQKLDVDKKIQNLKCS